MLFNHEIELIRPSRSLAVEVREALAESYELHKQYLPWAEPDPSLEQVSERMDVAAERFNTHEEEYRFFIRRLRDDRLLGCIGLHIRDLQIPHFEFGYWIRASEARKGYISRAVSVLEKYAVEELGARLLELHTAGTNLASRRVAEKCGFTLKEIRHDDRVLQDGCRDSTYVYFKARS